MLESTVYPGVTQNLIKKLLNKNRKKMNLDKDFFIGYSPRKNKPR